MLIYGLRHFAVHPQFIWTVYYCQSSPRRGRTMLNGGWSERSERNLLYATTPSGVLEEGEHPHSVRPLRGRRFRPSLTAGYATLHLRISIVRRLRRRAALYSHPKDLRFAAFRLAKGRKTQRKRASFGSQKTPFCKGTDNKLAVRQLADGANHALTRASAAALIRSSSSRPLTKRNFSTTRAVRSIKP